MEFKEGGLFDVLSSLRSEGPEWERKRGSKGRRTSTRVLFVPDPLFRSSREYSDGESCAGIVSRYWLVLSDVSGTGVEDGVKGETGRSGVG